MDKLERTKAEMGSNDAIADDVAAQAYVEQFALDTFQRADNAIRSNKVTAYSTPVVWDVIYSSNVLIPRIGRLLTPFEPLLLSWTFSIYGSTLSSRSTRRFPPS